MTIKINHNEISVSEPIITINDIERLKKAIDKISKQHSNIILNVENSFTFPSNLISHLLKLKEKGININVLIKDEILLELFNDLNLTQIINIRRKI